MAGKVKTWVWVIIAVVVIGILGIVAMAGVGLYFFSQHIETHEVSAGNATSDFASVKKRFAEQKPLIELDERGNFVRANTDRKKTSSVKAPESVYVMAFDPDDQRIVRINIPFWLLKMKSRGTSIVHFNGRSLDLDDLRITVDDLERFGPTLIVDHQSRSGERVLVWTQ